MKKSYLLFAVPALLLGACSSEEDGLVPTGNGVTFEVSLPADMATRAFADGLSANRLQYSVFEHSDKPDQPGKYLFDDEVQFPEGEWTTTVNLDLVKGKDYDVVFWASKSTSTTTTDPAGNQTTTVSSVYTFNPQTPSIHIDYTGIAVNDEGRDAFFGVKRKVHVENNATSEKVYLYRPFAQVNVGTDDLKAAQKAGFGTVEDNIKTDVYVDNVYADLNLYTGQASNKVNGGLTFAKAGLPKDADGRFPLNEEGKEPVYKYMSMNYILTGIEVNSGATFEKGDYVNHAQSENVNLKLKFYDGETEINTLEIPNVPVQRNYRTNIYGSLLTSKVAFEVTKEPTFFEPSHDVNAPKILPKDILGYYTWTYTPSSFQNDQTIKSVPVSFTAYDEASKTFTVNMGGYDVKATYDDNSKKVTFAACQQINGDDELRLRHFTSGEPCRSGNTAQANISEDPIIGICDGKSITFDPNVWIMIGLYPDHGTNATPNYYYYGSNCVMTKSKAPTPDDIYGTYTWNYSSMTAMTDKTGSWTISKYEDVSQPENATYVHIYIDVPGSDYVTSSLYGTFDHTTGALKIENAARLTLADTSNWIQFFPQDKFQSWIEQGIQMTYDKSGKLLFDSQIAIALLGNGAWLDIARGNTFVKQH